MYIYCGAAAPVCRITYRYVILHFRVWGAHVCHRRPAPTGIGHIGSQSAGPADPPIIPQRGRMATRQIAVLLLVGKIEICVPA